MREIIFTDNFEKSTMSEKISVEWNTKKSFVCVDYPAVVQNVDKMLKTIGGKEELSRVVENPTLRLPLRWRPDDAYCKPVYGDKANLTRVLFRVRRAKGNAEKSENLKVEMLGIIDRTYRFKTMADFQYLPMTRSENGGYKGAYEEIVPTKMHDFSWMNQPAPMFIPPIAFSRMDTPCDYDFRKEAPAPPNESPEEKNSDRRIGNSRKKRCRFAIYVKFTSAEIPIRPTPECESNVLEDGEELIKEVQRLFEKRPVWNKLALRIILNCSNVTLSAVLPYVSYYFLTGPWRALWVRYGYDPRKDYKAKMYQVIDLRLKRFGDVIPLYSRWRGRVYGEKAKISSHISEKTSVIHKEDLIGKASGSSLLTEAEVEEKAKYSYYKGVIPTRRQSLLQLCDIYLDQVQSLVRENDGREKHCDWKEGWFEEGFVVKCRTMLVQDIKNSLSCGGPEGSEGGAFESEQKNDSEFSSDDYEDEGE